MALKVFHSTEEQRTGLWRLLGAFDDACLAAAEGVRLLSMLLESGSDVREAARAHSSEIVIPLCDLITHILDVYALPPYETGAATVDSARFLDDPVCLVAVDASKLLRLLARQPPIRREMVAAGCVNVLLRLLHAKGCHADIATVLITHG